MNMKRAAIIFLILMVGICLAPGAFAEDYMVVYIHVDSGDIAAVYGADQLPVITAGGKIKASTKHVKVVSGKQMAKKVENVQSDKSYATFYAESSPGCRYIKHPACYYVKVCR
jgi:hypothetical protein